jgi:hypothetical protein
MKNIETTIYEVALYSNGSISAEMKTWHLATKVRVVDENKKKRKKRIYLHLDERKAA